ncbi:PREDICTED: gamma-tubulin complex component 5 [Propithecus coquereli]|uniref:gamma-tubulin complex component 5 n=1 Tax=Propithecus coquereli TaxID=379532 RepID=UPI00063FA443|nr:PREDICTED: gamma-tubulin complex component 5 [Propithecus coquereli]
MARPGASWSRLDREQERDVRELVRRVTGLQDEADPNFQLALNFAWSNFRFHRFLDVNSHKIEKTIEGIYEKFIIHSDLSKAASWKRLTEEFLNASLPSIKEIKTDAHYSILSLLLCLSDSPSNSNYVETPRDKEVEKKDDFDWGKYLMEGEEIDLADEPDDQSWLEQHVVHQYWTARPSRFPHSLHLHSNLATVWNTNEQIAAYGQVVFRLQEFIDEVMGHSSESLPPGSGSVPKKSTEAPFRTYQAFMWALYKYFISFKEELTEIEKCIINNDTTITLAIVVDKLSSRLAQLKVLHKVFSTGVAEVPPDTRNVVRASHLLNTLYKAILEYDSVGEASEQTVSLLFSLWVETVRPYLQTVDEWIVHGHLWDGAREFIIQRNKNVPVNHRDFWYATYTLYSVSEKTENEEKMSDNASASSGSDQGPSSRQHTMVSFLKPVLKQIIMAGKSMQLLKNLQCAESTTCQAAARDAERKSLYTLFLESVQSRLRRGEDSTPQVLTEQQATKENLIKMQSIAERHLELDDIHDPLLAINFARLYLEQSDFHEKFAGGDVCVDRSSESVTCQTFELTLRSCLYPHIDKQYLDCCGNLMQTLKKDYRLVEYLQAMRNFFLMEGGDTMYDFYTSIFDKIREKETWQNVSFLNVQLQEAVGQRYPEDSSRLSISFENVDTAKKKLPVHILDGLTLSYKVPWPVDIVISSECQKIYNQVFLLLLQIKWAKYSLDVLLFGELVGTAERPQFKEGLLHEQDIAAQFGPPKEPVRQQIHRMFLLRVKLMHFVNSLHNYIMTRILHSTGLEFQHQVEEAKDLDQLIKIHYRYLSTIHDRCLLREKVSFVKEAIMKVLNLALMFADGWHAGLGAWRMESIEKMESDFKNCHMFLVTILNKAVCRGSFPHLESLALSLMAGMEQS